MANVTKHRFASAKADGADLTQVQPSNWNDGHQFIGGAAGDVLTRDPTDANFGAVWTAGAGGKFINNSGTGNLGEWLPAGFDSATRVIFWDGTAAATIPGLKGGVNGQIVTVKNNSPNGSIASFPNRSASAAQAYQFANFATSGPTEIATNGSITWVNIGGFGWYLLAHEQGAWITPAFNAADYYGIAPLTWTVTAGAVVQAGYRLTGRTLQYAFHVDSTTVGGSPGPWLRRKVPGGFTLSGKTHAGIHGFANAGVGGAGLLMHETTTDISFFHDPAALTTWAIGSLTLRVSAGVEVQ